MLRKIIKSIINIFAPKNPEDISCPVCGYYCLGKGGAHCIDKPTLCGFTKERD
jgi:hypothetical protein